MTGNRLLALAGIVCVLGFMLSSVPARLLTGQLPAEVRATGVSGTLWNGTVARLNVQGLPLSDLEWDISLPGLVLGRLGGTIQARLPGGRASGKAALGLGGKLTLSEFEADAAARPVGRLIGVPQADGQVTLLVEELVLAGNWPRRLIGSGRVEDFPLLPDGTVPASFQVSFMAESIPPGGEIEGELRDAGGPLEVTGRLRLNPPANYELEGRVRARGEAPQELVNGLTFFGAPDAAGRREFSLAGSL